VLPYRFGNDQLRVRIDLRKDIHAHALTADKAVFFFFVVRMPALYRYAFAGKSFDYLALHLFLSGPALLIGAQAKITARNKNGFIRTDTLRLFDSGKCVHKKSFSFTAILFR